MAEVRPFDRLSGKLGSASGVNRQRSTNRLVGQDVIQGNFRRLPAAKKINNRASVTLGQQEGTTKKGLLSSLHWNKIFEGQRSIAVKNFFSSKLESAKRILKVSKKDDSERRGEISREIDSFKPSDSVEADTRKINELGSRIKRLEESGGDLTKKLGDLKKQIEYFREIKSQGSSQRLANIIQDKYSVFNEAFFIEMKNCRKKFQEWGLGPIELSHFNTEIIVPALLGAVNCIKNEIKEKQKDVAVDLVARIVVLKEALQDINNVEELDEQLKIMMPALDTILDEVEKEALTKAEEGATNEREKLLRSLSVYKDVSDRPEMKERVSYKELLVQKQKVVEGKLRPILEKEVKSISTAISELSPEKLKGDVSGLRRRINSLIKDIRVLSDADSLPRSVQSLHEDLLRLESVQNYFRTDALLPTDLESLQNMGKTCVALGNMENLSPNIKEEVSKLSERVEESLELIASQSRPSASMGLDQELTLKEKVGVEGRTKDLDRKAQRESLEKNLKDIQGRFQTATTLVLLENLQKEGEKLLEEAKEFQDLRSKIALLMGQIKLKISLIQKDSIREMEKSCLAGIDKVKTQKEQFNPTGNMGVDLALLSGLQEELLKLEDAAKTVGGKALELLRGLQGNIRKEQEGIVASATTLQKSLMADLVGFRPDMTERDELVDDNYLFNILDKRVQSFSEKATGGFENEASSVSKMRDSLKDNIKAFRALQEEAKEVEANLRRLEGLKEGGLDELKEARKNLFSLRQQCQKLEEKCAQFPHVQVAVSQVRSGIEAEMVKPLEGEAEKILGRVQILKDKVSKEPLFLINQQLEGLQHDFRVMKNLSREFSETLGERFREIEADIGEIQKMLLRSSADSDLEKLSTDITKYKMVSYEFDRAAWLGFRAKYFGLVEKMKGFGSEIPETLRTCKKALEDKFEWMEDFEKQRDEFDLSEEYLVKGKRLAKIKELKASWEAVHPMETSKSSGGSESVKEAEKSQRSRSASAPPGTLGAKGSSVAAPDDEMKDEQLAPAVSAPVVETKGPQSVEKSATSQVNRLVKELQKRGRILVLKDGKLGVEQRRWSLPGVDVKKKQDEEENAVGNFLDVFEHALHEAKENLTELKKLRETLDSLGENVWISTVLKNDPSRKKVFEHLKVAFDIEILNKGPLQTSSPEKAYSQVELLMNGLEEGNTKLDIVRGGELGVEARAPSVLGMGSVGKQETSKQAVEKFLTLLTRAVIEARGNTEELSELKKKLDSLGDNAWFKAFCQNSENVSLQAVFKGLQMRVGYETTERKATPPGLQTIDVNPQQAETTKEGALSLLRNISSAAERPQGDALAGLQATMIKKVSSPDFQAILKNNSEVVGPLLDTMEKLFHPDNQAEQLTLLASFLPECAAREWIENRVTDLLFLENVRVFQERPALEGVNRLKDRYDALSSDFAFSSVFMDDDVSHSRERLECLVRIAEKSFARGDMLTWKAIVSGLSKSKMTALLSGEKRKKMEQWENQEKFAHEKVLLHELDLLSKGALVMPDITEFSSMQEALAVKIEQAQEDIQMYQKVISILNKKTGERTPDDTLFIQAYSKKKYDNVAESLPETKLLGDATSELSERKKSLESNQQKNQEAKNQLNERLGKVSTSAGQLMREASKEKVLSRAQDIQKDILESSAFNDFVSKEVHGLIDGITTERKIFCNDKDKKILEEEAQKIKEAFHSDVFIDGLKKGLSINDALALAFGDTNIQGKLFEKVKSKLHTDLPGRVETQFIPTWEAKRAEMNSQLVHQAKERLSTDSNGRLRYGESGWSVDPGKSGGLEGDKEAVEELLREMRAAKSKLKIEDLTIFEGNKWFKAVLDKDKSSRTKFDGLTREVGQKSPPDKPSAPIPQVVYPSKSPETPSLQGSAATSPTSSITQPASADKAPKKEEAKAPSKLSPTSQKPSASVPSAPAPKKSMEKKPVDEGFYRKIEEDLKKF